jgi:hypothetical protein
MIGAVDRVIPMTSGDAQRAGLIRWTPRIVQCKIGTLERTNRLRTPSAV